MYWQWSAMFPEDTAGKNSVDDGRFLCYNQKNGGDYHDRNRKNYF